MGTQHLAGAFRRNVEGVLQCTSWVIRQEVQCVEVEVLCFHLWALGDFPAHAHEDVCDLLVEDRDRVQRTNLLTGGWNGDIHALQLENLSIALFFQNNFYLSKVLFGATKCHVDKAARILALILWDRSQGATCLRNGCVFTEVFAAESCELL